MNKISVFKYTNYRHFLRDLLEYTRQKDPEFSFRKFCKKSGIVSPSFLKHVIDDTRNLSKEGAQKFMLGFGIEGPEAVFFEILVQMNQAKSIEERNKHFQHLKKFVGFRQVCQLERDGFDYYRKWYHPAVRELVGMCKGFVTAKWVASKVNPRITVKAAQESLDLLLRLGLIEKTENSYRKKHALVKGFSDLKNMMLQNYHREMIDLGKESMERFSSENRNVTSVTISIPAEKITEIKDKISKLREDLLQMALQSKDPNMVVQVNFQEFPLTDKLELDERGQE